ncbi:MAG: LamG domain-containing protein, partial [Planctomycetota bacterium]
MCRQFIYPIFVVLVLTGGAMAQIDPASVTDGNVYLFENVGADVPDDSANNNTANLIGSPQVVDGLKGKALQFNGTSDGVHVPDAATVNLSTQQNRTVVAIFNCADVAKSEKQCVYDEGGTTRGLTIYVHEGLVYAGGWNLSDYTPEWTGTFLSAPISSNSWYAVAMVVRDGGAAQEDDKFEMWMDGRLIAKGPGAELRSRSNDCGIGYHNSQVKFHDGNVSATGSYFEGMIDEVWILGAALTEIDLGTFVGKVWPYAFSPSPADGTIYENTWVSLSWTPGGFAVSHDVYLSDNFDDVNTGAEAAFRGNQSTTDFIVGFPGFAYPDGLVPGTTYYWRVDEVNDADPNSPWKGDVWSFFIPPKTAYNPDPADGAKYVDPNVTLSWTPGFGAKLHNVYFGDNFDDVNTAAGAMPLADTTYTPGTLELGKTYYWRVDEFDGAATHRGDVLSFTVRPSIPISDPDLVCWWKLDEGQGTTVLDWSGHGNDATFTGSPQWVDGYDGGALNFNGAGDSVTYLFSDETWSAYTVALWVKADMLWQSNNSSICATYLTTNGGFQLSFDAANNYQYHADVDQIIGPASLSWIHLAVTYDGTAASAYYNGDFVATFTPAPDDLLANKYAIGINRAEDNWFDGSVDDFRVYSKALTQQEVQLVMRVDPLLAWAPKPTDGATVDIDNATPLSWSRGDMASQHDVYLDTDKDAVANADASDTTGIYRGSQSGTSYTPQDIAWGGGPYYWRVDENNTDGTVTRGRIWSFTVADFILVDDFESYTDDDAANEAIWQSWIDGFGVPANGSQVGYLLPPYAEQTIVNSGTQSMPLYYENTAGVTYSEAELILTAPRDWTKHELGELSLWFRGYPPSVGSFTEAPAGIYTMTGSGVDIWGTADEFHFAYKMLTGAGSIVARVDSVSNTHVWAKAGVMIRETLDAGSKHAFACVTPASGVAFQRRIDTDT